MTKSKKEKNEEEQNKVNESEESENKNNLQELNKEVDLLQKAEEKINELEVQIKEWQDKFLRKAAEFENYKRRSENDQFNLINYAAESFIIKLLPVVDDFERSLKHIDDENNTDSVKEGIKLMYDKFIKILDEQGVKKMKSKGEPFNVDYHDALMQKKDISVPPHTVLEEIEPGYIYRDRVIRHAKVIVSEDFSPDDNRISDDTSIDSIEENGE